MKRTLTLILALALILSGCGTAAPGSEIPGVTAENYPRVDGSDAALPVIQAAFMAAHPSYSGGDYPVEALGAEESCGALLAGGLDLVIAPDAPRLFEDAAAAAGVELEYTQIAADGLYAVVRADSPEGSPERLVAQWLADEALADPGPARD